MTLRIRTMTDADLPLGMLLREQAGWNQTEADWRRFLAMEPDGCFVAELDGQAVGTTVVTRFGSVAWVAMVLVDRSARGRGVGTALMMHALEHLDRIGLPTIRLDATPLGRPIYEKLGFVTEYEVTRWEGIAVPPHPNLLPKGGETCSQQFPSEPVTPELFDAVVELDRQVTGTNRKRLLEAFYRQLPEAMRAVRRRGRLVGYSTYRPGSRAALIGPAAATEPEAGLALAEAALESWAGRMVFADIPADNLPATAWAKARGLSIQRAFTRMARGRPMVDRPDQLWASSGPENG